MFDVAVSQLTSARWDSRWDLADELARLRTHGFEALSLWRPKVSDTGASATRRLLAAAGVRVSSLQWAGGFTGGDGRSFAESVDDALEALATAEEVGAPVLIVHSGCRGGHTRSHAQRLLVQALETLLPAAARAGVTLAVKPVHPGACPGFSFLADLESALDLVDQFDDATVRLALDLWHFGDDPGLRGLLPRLAPATAVVQVADRSGPPAPGADRLPAGHGGLPLEDVVGSLVEQGFDGPVEFDPVGEAVEILGYDGAWQETQLVADAWAERFPAPLARSRFDAGPLRGHFREGSGIRKSHASSHSGSAG